MELRKAQTTSYAVAGFAFFVYLVNGWVAYYPGRRSVSVVLLLIVAAALLFSERFRRARRNAEIAERDRQNGVF